MIYITGDTHGSISHLKNHVLPIAQHFCAEDLLVIAGDFGFIFAPEEPSPRFAAIQEESAQGLALLEALPCHIAFIDGNHENFSRLNRFPEEGWHGGPVHRISPRIVHLIRGGLYTVHHQRIAVLGGGLSIDKASRIPGVSWWAEELPSPEEMRRFQSIFDGNEQVDAVITHAAPFHVMRRLGYHPMEEAPLNTMLEEIYQLHRWKTWFFGHLHMDGDEGNGLYAVYRTIRNIHGKPVNP